MLSIKAKALMESGTLRFSLVAYGPQAGKMKIEPNGPSGKNVFAEIQSGKHKAELLEIKAHLQAQADAQRAERQRRIAAIPGLEALRAARADVERYRDQFAAMMDDAANDGVRRPPPPQTDLTALKATYPRAAAYLMAESWSHADHYRKAALGRAAMDAIINGDDPQSTIAEMDRLWSGHVSQHIWD